MKRGFWRWGLGTAVATLCFFVVIASASAADQGEPMRLVHIDNAAWQSNAVIHSTSADTELRTSDCTQFAMFTQKLPFDGSVLVDKLADNLCSHDNPGVAILPVNAGSVRAWAELTYRDALGNFNAVEIPSLPQPIAPRAPLSSQSYKFAGIEVDAKKPDNPTAGKSTYFAIFTEGGRAANLRLDIRDGLNRSIATEGVYVEGFAFYEMQTPLRIGNVVMTNEGLNFGAPGFTPANVYAVAFVGQRAGGSPRVEVPALSFAVAVP